MGKFVDDCSRMRAPPPPSSRDDAPEEVHEKEAPDVGEGEAAADREAGRLPARCLDLGQDVRSGARAGGHQGLARRLLLRLVLDRKGGDLVDECVVVVVVERIKRGSEWAVLNLSKR